MADNARLHQLLEENWQTEMKALYTYQALSVRERDPLRRAQLRSLADAERRHAEAWAERLRELGGPEPRYTGKLTGEADDLANRLGGPEMALRRLEMDESREIAKYAKQLRELDEKSAAILREVIQDEREHYFTLRSLSEQRPISPKRLDPVQARQLVEEILTRRDQGRPRASGWVGDAIYGVNDGLGAIFGIVSGVSGATLGNSHFVLLAGLAGMIASALSMGSGAYLAAKSEREIYAAELVREREAITYNGSEARELLSLFFQLKGLPPLDADHVVEHVAKDQEQFVRTLAAERLNLNEEALRKPWVSAFTGASSTALGAFIPVIPFFWMSGFPAVIAAAVISLIAHFGVGAAKALVTVRPWWSSGLEMTAVGAIEGVITYAVGLGLGHLGA